MASKTPARRALSPSPDDWHFLAQGEAAQRFGCGVDTVKAMVEFEAAGVLPSFPSIGSKKQICPELMKQWLLQMASTEEGRSALRDLKAQDRHK